MIQVQAAIYPWHQTIWLQLQSAFIQQQLPHALLFSGETGCGHEQLVYSLAQSLLCLQPNAKGVACKHCRSCTVFAAQAHPDFMLLAVAEDKQAITVDQVRSLDRFLELSHSYSTNRVVVILEAEAMNNNAANSLLKSLEEPTNNSYILLFTKQVAKLLPTIRSRCQQLRMPLPSQILALEWLKQHSLPDQAANLLSLAKGRPLAALGERTEEKAIQQALFFNQLKSVLAGTIGFIELSSHWEKHDRSELLDWQLHWLQQLIKYEAGDRQANEALELLPYLQSKSCWVIYDRLLELKALSTHPLNGRLFIENMLSSWL